MPVEFVGIARTADSSETVTEVGPAIQPDYLYRIAQAHEQSGFDALMVTHTAASPDGFVVADQVLNVTTRLRVQLAHRPGFVAPMVAASRFATIDSLHPGRIALHAITGGDDADQRRDGDFADKDARYRRTDEFLDIVRLAWQSPDPFDYAGEFYRVSCAALAIRPPAGQLPVYFGGASGQALAVGAKHADVYAFWGEPLGGISDLIGRVRAAAAGADRSIDKFSVSLRPIVADTEAAAWRRASELLELASERMALLTGPPAAPQAEGSRRLLRYAAAGDLHDERLWTALSRVTGAPGNSTALVGSYEQVAKSLLDYVAVGASTLLIRGYDPLADAVEYGNLIRLVQAEAGEDLDAYRTCRDRGAKTIVNR